MTTSIDTRHDASLDRSTSATRDSGRDRGLLRAGGIAALIEALTFLVGIAMAVTVLADYATGELTPTESVAFLADHRGAVFAWHAVTLILFSVALVPLTLALHDRLRRAQPSLARVAAVFGCIWAGLIAATGMISNVGTGAVVDLAADDTRGAASLWSALDAVTNGLGGGNEVVGGVWVLLLSVAGLRSGLLPTWLNVVGLLSAAAGLVTVVPGLEEVGIVFGLGLIVWFVGVGVSLLRRR